MLLRCAMPEDGFKIMELEALCGSYCIPTGGLPAHNWQHPFLSANIEAVMQKIAPGVNVEVKSDDNLFASTANCQNVGLDYMRIDGAGKPDFTDQATFQGLHMFVHRPLMFARVCEATGLMPQIVTPAHQMAQLWRLVSSAIRTFLQKNMRGLTLHPLSAMPARGVPAQIVMTTQLLLMQLQRVMPPEELRRVCDSHGVALYVGHQLRLGNLPTAENMAQWLTI